ncbi:MAG TPA: hypothetical protein VMF30_10600 [Pirellulales bacterium]|nr:hypothetical protein [Pirellulales bacterium]
MKTIEERHVQLAKHRVVFPASEAKGKTRVRLIYMTKRAEEIVRRLLKARPKGILFRNTKGRPWNVLYKGSLTTTILILIGSKCILAVVGFSRRARVSCPAGVHKIAAWESARQQQPICQAATYDVPRAGNLPEAEEIHARDQSGGFSILVAFGRVR